MYKSLEATAAEYPRVDVLEAIVKRHSVHEFKTDPVPEEMLLALVDAARQAPSSRNLQP
ncbi:MAG: nitroreductase family protein, partial [Mycobacterium leprae]